MNTRIKQVIQDYQRRFLDFIVREYASADLEKRAEFFTGCFEKDLPPKSTILDIGGGWGFYHKPLQDRGHAHAVIDVVNPGFQKCPVTVYDGDRIPFSDKSFDVSLLITVLHHIPDPEHVILEAKRVTRKRLIVVEDLFHHPLGKIWTSFRDQLYNFEFFGHAGQFRSKPEWIEIFERCGFSLVREEERMTWLAGMRILNGVFVFELK